MANSFLIEKIEPYHYPKCSPMTILQTTYVVHVLSSVCNTT